MVHHGYVRIPARHATKHEASAFAITGGDITNPVLGFVSDRLFATAAFSPKIFHRISRIV